MPRKPPDLQRLRTLSPEQLDQALIQAAIAEAHRRITRTLSEHFAHFSQRQQRQVRALLGEKARKAPTPGIRAKPKRKSPT